MTEELEKDYYADRPTEPYSDDDSPNDWANIAHYAEENLEKAFKRIEELELKIKHLTQHLEPQAMTALFEQVEEEVKQEQRIKELEAQIEKMKQCSNCGNGTIGNCEHCKRKPKQKSTDTDDYWRLKEIKEK